MDREYSQMPITEKIKKSDIIVHNESTCEELQAKAERLFDSLMKKLP